MQAHELLLAAYLAMPDEEQELAFHEIGQARLRRLADDQSEADQFLWAMRQVAAEVGGPPVTSDYVEVREKLRRRGVEIPHHSSLIRHYGSWRRAKEALQLSEDTSVARIEARFRSRKIDKVWRYSPSSLEKTLRRCAAEIGRAPLVSEFDHWRTRELQLAEAQGLDLHLPSASPYRRHFGDWERAVQSILGLASQERYDPLLEEERLRTLVSGEDR